LENVLRRIRIPKYMIAARGTNNQRLSSVKNKRNKAINPLAITGRKMSLGIEILQTNLERK